MRRGESTRGLTPPASGLTGSPAGPPRARVRRRRARSRCTVRLFDVRSGEREGEGGSDSEGGKDRTIRTVYDLCPARFEVMIGGEQQLGIDGNDELISEFRQKQERSWKRRGLRLLVRSVPKRWKVWSISR